MKAPINLNLREAQDEKPTTLRERLNALLRRLDTCYHQLRSDTEAIDTKINNGVATGWVDDGANFRITVTNGIITAIGDSSGAGHS